MGVKEWELNVFRGVIWKVFGFLFLSLQQKMLFTRQGQVRQGAFFFGGFGFRVFGFIEFSYYARWRKGVCGWI